jgi:hypothetical protein
MSDNYDMIPAQHWSFQTLKRHNFEEFYEAFLISARGRLGSEFMYGASGFLLLNEAWSALPGITGANYLL